MKPHYFCDVIIERETDWSSFSLPPLTNYYQKQFYKSSCPFVGCILFRISEVKLSHIRDLVLYVCTEIGLAFKLQYASLSRYTQNILGLRQWSINTAESRHKYFYLGCLHQELVMHNYSRYHNTSECVLFSLCASLLVDWLCVAVKSRLKVVKCN